jgi:hypothetical protein
VFVWSADSTSLKNDRPQHDRPTSFFYRSTVFFHPLPPSRFHSVNEKFGAVFKLFLFPFYKFFLNCLPLNFCNSGGGLYVFVFIMSCPCMWSFLFCDLKTIVVINARHFLTSSLYVYVFGLTFYSPQSEGFANIIYLKWSHNMKALSSCQSVRHSLYVYLWFMLHLGSTLRIISKLNFGLQSVKC